MYESVELNEGVADIVKKVEKLKVGDKTNFGVVKEISANSITFKAKDTPKTKILFKQPKLGSRDFVLDQLVKLTPDGKRLAKESTDLEEATMSQGVKQAQKHIDSLESSLKKGSNLNKGINKALEGKYDADFIKMEKAMSQILDVWQDIEYEFAQSVSDLRLGESVELGEAYKELELNWDMDDPSEHQDEMQAAGVHLDDWDERNSTITITGDEKDLLKWLVSDYGLDKKEAQSEVRKGKKIKESVELDEAIKAGSGKITVHVDWNPINKAFDKAAERKYKIKLKVTPAKLAGHSDSVSVTGDKKNVLAYLQSGDYGVDISGRISAKGLPDGDIKDMMPEILETYDKLDEASESDLKKILDAAKKAGGRVKGNTADFGMGASIEFSIEKGKIKFDGGRATGVGYFDNVDDALASLAAGLG